MNKTAGNFSLHTNGKGSKHEESLKRNTAFPAKRPQVLLFSSDEKKRSISHFSPFLKTYTHKTKNFDLNKDNQLKTATIKMNMSNHFVILNNLMECGKLQSNKNFHYLSAKENDKYNKNNEENKHNYNNLFRLAKTCNRELLDKQIKDIKINNKAIAQSAKLIEIKKNIMDIKKNFFYFEKKNIVKKDLTKEKKNAFISEVYHKYFNRKNQNKLCNLKEFSGYLQPKCELNMQEESICSGKEENHEKNKKKQRLPQLKIQTLNKKLFK